MAVVILDPRFPAMLPAEAYPLLSGDVCYTEEVPVRVRWTIADFGGHTVESCDVLVTTDEQDDAVAARVAAGERVIQAPSLGLVFADEDGDKALPTPQQASAPISSEADGGDGTPGPNGRNDDSSRPDFHGVPVAVLEDIAAAIAVTSRALRQGGWEREQTHESLLPYLQEEAGEYADAVRAWHEDRTPETEKQLCSELGDVLLQVLFHAEIANRRGTFDIGHVANAYVDKLRRRAPYYFGDDDSVVAEDEQIRLWEAAKVKERSEGSE